MSSETVFDLAILDVRPRTVVASLEKVEEFIAAADTSTLLGCWYSEIGTVNRIVLLRSPTSLAALSQERSRLVLDRDPFGCAEHIVHLSMDTCVAIGPADVGSSRYGATYEIVITATLPTSGGALITLRHVTGAMPRFTQFVPWRDADTLLGHRLEQNYEPLPGEFSGLFNPAKFSPIA